MASNDDTLPSLPPVVELDDADVEDEDAPWAGFHAEVSRLRSAS